MSTPYWRRQFSMPPSQPDDECNDTTKRFSRTLGEAFHDAGYGAAIEVPAPRPSLLSRMFDALRWIVAFLLLAAMLSSPHWWTP